MSNPFFTIIVPTYNRRHCLGVAIQSVVAQTYTDWELIIVDDGSTDKTDEYVLTQFSDPRIHYFLKEHEERSAARNFGLDRAKGQYVCFLDSDDEYLEGYLQLHYDAICTYPGYKVFRVGTILRKFGKDYPLPAPDPSWSSFEAICRNFNSPCSYCFKAELLSDIRFDTRFHISQDFHLIARIIKQHDFYQINRVGFVYYYNAKSELMYSNNHFRIKNKLECFEDLLLILPLSEFEKNFILLRISIVYKIAVYTLIRFQNVKLVPTVMKSIWFFVKNPKFIPNNFNEI